MTKLDADLATFNDTIAVASALVTRLAMKGLISDVHKHQVVAVLNSSIYTLVFAMPPGSSPIQLSENGDTIVTQKLEPTKPLVQEGKAKRG